MPNATTNKINRVPSPYQVMKTSLRLLCVGLILLLATSSNANADILYGTEFGGSSGVGTVLYEIDKTDGSHTTVGIPPIDDSRGLLQPSRFGLMPAHSSLTGISLSESAR